ncbi:MAG: UDP-N-acetylmuramoyl-L-alanine--D-glutamate ligase [Candidatus Gastranaerophilales bacterium]|nr:UDP-N-acetylmuramoyl-L-alanine--D-glutamate ligase [Candidatus Gastranaerophilales bacterium]
MQLAGKNITVLGLSISGIAVAKYAARNGAYVVITEKRSFAPRDEALLTELNALKIKVEMGFHSDEVIKNADIIVTSPGIPPHSDVFTSVEKYNKEVISEIDFAYLNKPEKSEFITITGTNGKTTTTKLLSEILTNAGFKAPFCGNIGIPPTSLLDEDVDFFVTEISSYQINYTKYLKPYVSAFLNYTSDHVTWHGSEEEYLRVKASHFIGENTPEYAVLNFQDKNVREIADKTTAKVFAFDDEFQQECVFERNSKIFYKKDQNIEKICDLTKARLFGRHNYQNIACAVSVAKILGVDNNIIQKTIEEFAAPEHRIEFVREIGGIKYYNDSKATNCDSTICALKAFKDKVVLIAGGRDKMTDLGEFCETVVQKVSDVILIGEAAERFEQNLRSFGFKNILSADSLEEAVDIAGKLNHGDVLLSPACASFDMFNNFEERGKAFKNYVLQK